MPTNFEKSVWSALNKIPKGKVTTYSEIANFLGKPRAVRAVGTAVGKNPDAPQVPCHRVIPKSGKIGNYSGVGGPEGKIQLLEKEGISINNGKVHNLEKNFYLFT